MKNWIAEGVAYEVSDFSTQTEMTDLVRIDWKLHFDPNILDTVDSWIPGLNIVDNLIEVVLDNHQIHSALKKPRIKEFYAPFRGK